METRKWDFPIERKLSKETRQKRNTIRHYDGSNIRQQQQQHHTKLYIPTLQQRQETKKKMRPQPGNNNNEDDADKQKEEEEDESEDKDEDNPV